MRSRVMRELRVARRSFAALAAILLVLPLLLGTLPRPAQATADYIAGLTGYSICSSIGMGQPEQKPTSQSPCESCMPGAMCPGFAAVPPVFLSLLAPPRMLAGILAPQAQPLQTEFIAAVRAARGPPSLA